MAQSIPAFDTNDHVNRLKSGLRDQVIVTKACEPASGVSTLVCEARSSPVPHGIHFQNLQMLNVIFRVS